MDGQVSMTVPVTPKRLAIIGTAPSWRQCPWDDTDLVIACLNDAYMLNVPRANVWFDLHPFDKFYYRPKAQKAVYAHDIPIGHYVRPEGHIEWLASQPIPVFVQKPVSPNMVAFPYQQVEAFLAKYQPEIIGEPMRAYVASTPAWMVAWAILEGFTEISIYGIHLATEWEYVAQRPNMEFLMGVAGALGGTIRPPKASPIGHADHRYAFDPKPDLDIEAVKRSIALLQMKHQKIDQAMKARKWWQSAADLVRQKRLVDARLIDKKLEIQRLTLAKRIA
jgi:hypothetical protein